jgi:Berberine and berberine like
MSRSIRGTVYPLFTKMFENHSLPSHRSAGGSSSMPQARQMSARAAGLLGEERVREAYPGSTWERLVAVKGRYDPTNLFRLNQNIPPSSETRTTEQKERSGG